MTKYIQNKIKIFLNDNSIQNSIDMTPDTLENFKNSLPSFKQTKKMIELVTMSQAGDTIISNTWLSIKNSLASKEAEKLIRSELRQLFVENENEHVGTSVLNSFYSRHGIDYGIVNARIKHSSRISAIRQDIRNETPTGTVNYYLISGKIMKEKLGITYPEGERDSIDGWCYTNNKDWLSAFFTDARTKHEAIAGGYLWFENNV